jgi:hypothetical protein
MNSTTYKIKTKTRSYVFKKGKNKGKSNFPIFRPIRQ